MAQAPSSQQSLPGPSSFPKSSSGQFFPRSGNEDTVPPQAAFRASSIDSYVPPPPAPVPIPDSAVRFSGTSKSSSTASMPQSMSRAESEAVFSRVEYVSVETGRYYNSSRDRKGGGSGMTPPKITLVDSGYVVYEILVKANFDANFAWTCHRRYNNFLELEEGLPTLSRHEEDGCIWDDAMDTEFDYEKGVRTSKITNEPTSALKARKNTYPPRPILPPKKLLGNFSLKLIESRRVGLNKYLRYLFLNPYTRSSEAFLSFIAAEQLIGTMQMNGLTPATSTFFTSQDSNGSSPNRNSAVGFVPTPSPAKNQKTHGAETLTSFPYAFRSTNGGGALGGWGEGLGSERKKKRKKKKKIDDAGGGLCLVL